MSTSTSLLDRRPLHRAMLLLPTVLLPAAALAIAARGQIRPPANVAANAVDYDKQVKPLLTVRCYACHGNGTKLGGLSLESRDAALKGGQSGPAVLVGHSEKSLLIKLVSGGEPNRVMPARGPRLTKAEIDLLRAWIDQGLSFGSARTADAWTPPLHPRRPVVPAPKPGSGLSNPIDLLLQPYFAALKIQPAAPVDDGTYARRAYLDIVGLLPRPQELQAFLGDKRPDKRAQLARALLSDDRNYAEHWITFWNDMLRNDYAGTGYIDGGRKQITDWLYDALATDMPYDRFVAQLVNPTPACEGFVDGIVWRGVVNASQTPQMQAAQNISQVFMGVNLKCASCHNSFISTWKLADAYGMAGIYNDKALEMVRCDKPTGEVAPIKFLFSELGRIDGDAPKPQRMEQLSKILTSRENGRLARTLVNRIWAKLMGRGLVEPADEMDNRPWDPDLLDWLASDFADGGYDVKKLIERIVTSRAYQLPATGLPSDRISQDFVFRGPVIKRMSAEQFCDAVSILTGVWQRPAVTFRIGKGEPQVPAGKHGEIKFKSGLMKSGSVDIDVDVSGAQTLSLIVTDAGDGANYDWADWADARLVGPQGEIKLTDLKWSNGTTGYGEIQTDKSVVEKPILLGEKTFANGIGTHANSVISWVLPPGVTRFRATAGPDANGVKEGSGKTSIALFVVTGERSLIEARASMAYADPLMRALDRPNREQTVTERSTVCTTLQALELTNGKTLATTITEGADTWTRQAKSPEQTVDAIYEQALGRTPTPAEKQAAIELVGTPVRRQGIEDLLWALVMLPEFQLVY